MIDLIIFLIGVDLFYYYLYMAALIVLLITIPVIGYIAYRMIQNRRRPHAPPPYDPPDGDLNAFIGQQRMSQWMKRKRK